MAERANLLRQCAAHLRALAGLVERLAEIEDDAEAEAIDERDVIDPDQPLDRNATSLFLAISPAQLDRLRRRPEFPKPLMIGESPRWFRDELVQWLKSRREGGQPLRAVK